MEPRFKRHFTSKISASKRPFKSLLSLVDPGNYNSVSESFFKCIPLCEPFHLMNHLENPEKMTKRMSIAILLASLTGPGDFSIGFWMAVTSWGLPSIRQLAQSNGVL